MRVIASLATLALFLASCGGRPALLPSATPQASRTPAALLAMELTDVRTGQRFTLSSFVGKTVIVEGMAVW